MNVATLPWLLRHELHLWWRELNSKPGLKTWGIVLGFLSLVVLVPLWFALTEIRQTLSVSSIPAPAIWVAVTVWLIGFFIAFTQAMSQSVVALFERGDLDLLVSSPMSSKVIFASRLLGVALKIFLSDCLFIIPISLLALLLGVPQLLGVYPAFIGLALATTSLAMLLTLWLVRWLGARRARTWSQILTASLTALLFLLSQLPNVLRSIDVPTAGIGEQLRPLFSPGNPLSAESIIWFPARAMFFEPVSVLLTLLVSAGLTWLAVDVLHHSFITGTQESMTHKRKQRRPQASVRFTSGFHQMALFKEWRIIWRNPYLLSQTFLQMLFLIPALIIVLRGSQEQMLASLTTFVATVVSIVGSALVSSLTRICVSGEEAPDLLKASPVQGTTLRQVKLLAALIPVWILFSPIFIILLAKGEPWWLALLVFLGATSCNAILRLWNSHPVPLANMFKRHKERQGDVILGMLEVASVMTWGFLGFQAGQGHIGLAAIALAVIGGLIAIAYWRSRQLGSSLGF
ncbi:MAG: hypothetical protein RIB93_26590 [Coleofasciculus sp. D1-CHI-01]|uniref:hypothetical protein n=1 Tax=Coleofasciculus sp. D1-CHI-01 TaxID=3068482 RepID=UPI0032FDC8FE